jgi:hypothetical protein
MLMRAEVNKFKDQSIAKVEGELLCGDRKAVIKSYDGND